MADDGISTREAVHGSHQPEAQSPAVGHGTRTLTWKLDVVTLAVPADCARIIQPTVPNGVGTPIGRPSAVPVTCGVDQGAGRSGQEHDELPTAQDTHGRAVG